MPLKDLEARKKYMKEYRKRNKEQLREKARQYYQDNKEKIIEEKQKYYQKHKTDIKEKIKGHTQWLKFKWFKWFEKIYGKNPKCEICGKILNLGKSVTNRICFDHRYSGEAFIKEAPSKWCLRHPCNLKNQEIWLSCDFGILCDRCNNSLPTKDRTKWLYNVNKYIKKRGCRCIL